MVRGTIEGEAKPDCTGKKDGDEVEVRHAASLRMGTLARLQAAKASMVQGGVRRRPLASMPCCLPCDAPR